MTRIEKLARRNIWCLTPYSTARDEASGSIDIYLDANESPYDDGINRYPDPRSKRLRNMLSLIYNVEPEKIVVGNGSDETIDLVIRVFCTPGVDNIVSISPTYGMYKVCAGVNDVEYRELPLNNDFGFDNQDLLALTDCNTKLIFVCNPNNPTSLSLSTNQLRELASKFEGLLVIDEAYIEFSKNQSMTQYIDEFDNIIILRTLSKAYGMAGLRIGSALANQEIINLLSKVKYPYNIDVLSEWEAVCRLMTRSSDKIDEIKRERESLELAIKELAIFDNVIKSDTNFLLVQTDDAKRIYDYLSVNQIMVRRRSFNQKEYLRITVGTPSQNRVLLSALGELKIDESREERLRVVCLSSKTNETDIRISLNLDGSGKSKISTGIGFFDHMLTQIPVHSMTDLEILAEGDFSTDDHHIVEDTGLLLGRAFNEALGDKKGIERYGFVLPMDESQAKVVLDFGGRDELVWLGEFKRERVGELSTEMISHFFKSFARGASCNIHVEFFGENDHHKAEAIFKSFARAIRQAIRRDSGNKIIPSSKGSL